MKANVLAHLRSVARSSVGTSFHRGDNLEVAPY